MTWSFAAPHLSSPSDEDLDAPAPQDLAFWELVDGEAALVVPPPPDERSVVLEAKARLADRRFRWVEPPVLVPAGETASLRLHPPRDAFLDPVAERYLTTVVVSATLGDVTVDPGPVQLLWPDGPDADPIVWTVARASIEAPFGTLDPDARPADTEGRTVVVQAPLTAARARAARLVPALREAAWDTGFDRGGR